MAESTIESKRNSLIIRIIIWEAIIIFLCSIFVRSPQKKNLFVLLNLFFMFILLQIFVYGIHIYPYYFAYKDNITDRKMLKFKADLNVDLPSTLIWMMIYVCVVLSIIFLLGNAYEVDEKKQVPLLLTVFTYAVTCILLYFYIIRNNKRYKDIKENIWM